MWEETLGFLFRIDPMINKSGGQSTIEFLFAFIFAIGFIVAFVQLAISSGYGFLVQHATFQAARSFLVYDNNAANPQTSDRAAREYALGVLFSERYGLPAINLGQNSDLTTQINDFDSGALYEYVGLVARFEIKISPLPFVGGNQKVQFVSESFLGREPSKGACYNRLCQEVYSSLNEMNACTGNDNFFITLYDNGC